MIIYVAGIISWKCESCSWWVEIYPKMGPICLIPGPNSTKFSRADRMDFIPLANPNMSEGSSLLRKMEWNYPSRALCLIASRTIFRTLQYLRKFRVCTTVTYLKADTYSEPSQRFKMDFFPKIVKNYKYFSKTLPS